MEIQIVKLPMYEGLDLPFYATPGSAGLDLLAAIKDDVTIESLERVLVPTGLRIKIPEGYVGLVTPRSGNALNKGLGIVNSPGIVDSDYCGESKVILVNLSKNPIIIKRGDRIAQMVILAANQFQLRIVNELEQTQRGSGGFGSTDATVKIKHL